MGSRAIIASGRKRGFLACAEHRLQAGCWLLAAALALCLPGCAFGHHGTLLARRTLVKGAEVVDVHALGLLVRPTSIDGGLTVGYRHATYIFPRESIADEEPRSDWLWFHAPLGDELPLLRTSTSLGLELQWMPEIKRVSLGYLDQVVTDGGGAEDSRIVRLHFNRHDALATTLEIKPEPTRP